jgi:hypothetical protein
MGFGDIGLEVVDWIGWGPVAGSFEGGNGLSDAIKGKEFYD